MFIKTTRIENKKVVGGSSSAGNVRDCFFGEHAIIDEVYGALEDGIDKMLVLIEIEPDDCVAPVEDYEYSRTYKGKAFTFKFEKGLNWNKARDLAARFMKFDYDEKTGVARLIIDPHPGL